MSSNIYISQPGIIEPHPRSFHYELPSDPGSRKQMLLMVDGESNCEVTKGAFYLMPFNRVLKVSIPYYEKQERYFVGLRLHREDEHASEEALKKKRIRYDDYKRDLKRSEENYNELIKEIKSLTTDEHQAAAWAPFIQEEPHQEGFLIYLQVKDGKETLSCLGFESLPTDFVYPSKYASESRG